MKESKNTTKSRLENLKIIQIYLNNKYIFISGFAAIFIMAFVFIVFQAAPFGGSTVLRMDLYHQYGPLFAELYDRVTGFQSLFYSWTSGMGGSFLGNFLNYLSNPFAIIIFILGHKRMPESIALMMMLSAGFSAGTFTYYIKKSFNRHDLSSAAFGLFYAFCAYFVAYSWNIMWLSGMIILPLVLLGIQYIVEGKKPYLYLFALTYAMLTNYYMAFMICIMAVVYFLYYFYIQEKENRFKNFLFFGSKFAISSLAAAGLVAVLFIPLYFILQASSATGHSLPSEYKSYFSILDFLANHFAGIEPTIRSSGDDVFPNIYSGILPLVLIPFYLYSKTISLREKISSSLLLVFFYLSFNINYLNFAWHGFKFPNDLPYRQSFIYSFIIIMLAYKVFIRLDEFASKHFLTAGLAFVSFIVLVQKIGQKNVSDFVVWASIVFAGLYVIIISLFKNKKFQKDSAMFMLILAVSAELIVCNTPNYVMSQKKINYVGDYNDFVAMQEMVKENESKNSFYREELTNLRTRMDPSWYNYRGVSIFSSMAYENVSKLQNRLGMFSNAINSHTYNPQTPIYNSMFSLKYLYDKNSKISDKGGYYKKLYTNDTFTCYEYKNFLPLAFGVNPNMAEEFLFDNNQTDPFILQSEFFTAATGAKNFFIPLDMNLAPDQFENCSPIYDYDLISPNLYYSKPNEKNTGSFILTLDINQDQNVFIYGRSDTIKNINLGSVKKSEYTGLHEKYDFNSPAQSFITDRNQAHIFDAGYHKAGTSLALRVNLPEDNEKGSIFLKAVGFNDESFKQGYNRILANGTLEIDEFKETLITGHIEMSSNMLLYTSIPYDEGWSVKIDGDLVPVSEYKAIGNAFLAVPISKGHHEISFKYSPKGIKLGFVISLATLALLLIYVFIDKKGLIQKHKTRLPFIQDKDLLNEVKAQLDKIDNFESFTDEEPFIYGKNDVEDEEPFIYEENEKKDNDNSKEND